MPATQNCLGPGAGKLRRTRSLGNAVFGSDFVVKTRLDFLTPANPGEPHQPRSLVPADLPPQTTHQRMHRAPPREPGVLRAQARDLGNEPVNAQAPSRRCPGLRRAIPARGYEPLECRARDPADELDPEALLVLVDRQDHLGQGRSSPLATSMLADFKISLALRSSAFARLSRRQGPSDVTCRS